MININSVRLNDDGLLKTGDWKIISQEESTIILEGIISDDQKLPNNEDLSNILEFANKNLKKTLFHYLTDEEAKKKFGEQCESYIQKNGLPCVTSPLLEEMQYIRDIIRVQLKMHEELLDGIITRNTENLSLYVFYSVVHHRLSTLGWEKL